MDRAIYKALKNISKGNRHKPQISKELFYEISKRGYILPTSNRSDLLVLTDKGKKAMIEERSRRRGIWIPSVVAGVCTLATIVAAVVLSMK